MSFYTALVALLWIWSIESAALFLYGDYLLVVKAIEQARRRRHVRALRKHMTRRALERMRTEYDAAYDGEVLGIDPNPGKSFDGFKPPVPTVVLGDMPQSPFDELDQQRRRAADVEHARRWPR